MNIWEAQVSLRIPASGFRDEGSEFGRRMVHAICVARLKFRV